MMKGNLLIQNQAINKSEKFRIKKDFLEIKYLQKTCFKLSKSIFFQTVSNK
jgi:hypothetical protein